jgi:pantetheine-phosphate adenylyltransferase
MRIGSTGPIRKRIRNVERNRHIRGIRETAHAETGYSRGEVIRHGREMLNRRESLGRNPSRGHPSSDPSSCERPTSFSRKKKKAQRLIRPNEYRASSGPGSIYALRSERSCLSDARVFYLPRFLYLRLSETQTKRNVMNRTALFPGSFDPFTLGHKIVVDQGLELFERIVIAVGVNTEKRGLLTPENRARLIRDLYRNDSRIEVVIYNELTGKVCRQLGIDTILRGLRNTVDFEYERNIMQVNQTLFPEIKTVLLFTPARYVAISSSVIRELVTFGGDPTPLMPENIDIKNYL